MLNQLYTIMDHLASRFNLYKVETIGDAYMCCSGLPTPDENHAQNIANFALAVSECVRLVESPADGSPLQLRIGIHTGHCMGKEKLIVKMNVSASLKSLTLNMLLQISRWCGGDSHTSLLLVRRYGQYNFKTRIDKLKWENTVLQRLVRASCRVFRRQLRASIQIYTSRVR